MRSAKAIRSGRPPLPEGDAKTSQLQIRIEPARKAAYVKAAQRSNHRKLSPWATEQLDRAAGYSGD